MSTGLSNRQQDASDFYGQLTGSLGRARQVVEDSLNMGDFETAFTALSIYSKRAEEVETFLRDAAVGLQADALGQEDGT